MKLLLAGDTHGNIHQFNYLHYVMREREIGYGIVLGDFGLWPGRYGKKFLNDLEELCVEDGIAWDWLDGNHEDHTRIQQWMQREDAYSRRHEVTPHVGYLPRSYRFEIDGCRFMTLGGAWSIDKDSRTPYIDWWPEEELTMADLMRALESTDPIDVLLTHDMPADQEAVTAIGFRMAQGGDQNRRFVSEVMYALKPKLLAHGHMHRRYSCRVGGTQIEGVDCDGNGFKSFIIIDTDDWKSDAAEG